MDLQVLFVAFGIQLDLIHEAACLLQNYIFWRGLQCVICYGVTSATDVGVRDLPALLVLFGSERVKLILITVYLPGLVFTVCPPTWTCSYDLFT